jgi:hypothetical protein
MARDNAGWGYSRLQGALRHLGHVVARTTIANILKPNGIQPAPERPTSWRTFLKTHAGSIAAADFFAVEVWTYRPGFDPSAPQDYRAGGQPAFEFVDSTGQATSAG